MQGPAISLVSIGKFETIGIFLRAALDRLSRFLSISDWKRLGRHERTAANAGRWLFLIKCWTPLQGRRVEPRWSFGSILSSERSSTDANDLGSGDIQFLQVLL
jgi:hypothetical protein